MRTRDIKQWLSAADPAEAESPYDPDDDMAPENQVPVYSTQLEEAESDWDAFITHAAARLRDRKEKRRYLFVSNTVPLVASDSETSSEERVELFQLLLQTTLSYNDRKSRVCLVRAGCTLLDADTAHCPKQPLSSMLVREAVHALQPEVERTTRSDLRLCCTALRLVALYDWVYCVLSYVLHGEHASIKNDSNFMLLVKMYARLHGTYVAALVRKHMCISSVSARLRQWESDPGCLSLLLHAALKLPAAEALASCALQGHLITACCLEMKDTQRAGALELVQSIKVLVLQFYSTNVLSSRVPLLDTLRTAKSHPYRHFFKSVVTPADLDEHVLPTLQKMLLRSPEQAFYDLGVLCTCVAVEKTSILSRFQNVMVSSIASSNPATREAVLSLSDSLFKADDITAFADAVCKSIKAGDVRSEEQRLAQYKLLWSCVPNESNSPGLLGSMAPVLLKETQPSSVAAAVDAVSKHIHFLLEHDVEVPSAFMKAFIGKTSSPKPPVRAAALCGMYPAICACEPGMTCFSKEQKNWLAFWKDLLPSLGTSVKSALSSALTSPEAALEGCIATALIWGAISQEHSLRDSALPLAPLDALLATGAKPSFLLNEKVAQKMSELHTVHWHAKAFYTVLHHTNPMSWHDKEFASHMCALLRCYVYHTVQIGAPNHGPLFVQGARWHAHRIVQYVHRHDERLALHIVRHVLSSEPELPTDVARLLVECMSSLNLFPELVVLVHAPQLQDTEHDCFVKLCRNVMRQVGPTGSVTYDNLDPHEILRDYADSVIQAIYEAQSDPTWRVAAEAALASILFIAPDAVLGRICGDIVRDMSVKSIEAFSEQDVAIWRASDDKPFIDVLSSNKQELDKGRTTSMDKWDAEVRASIAAKKAATTPKSLTKQEQAAVDTQLAREREIRSLVEHERTRVILALNRAFIVARARATSSDIFALTVAVRACLGNVRARELGVTDTAVDALAMLSRAGEARVQTVCGFILSAMLREIDGKLVPLDYSLESGEEIELRILYQLRFLVDAAPLERSSCGFVIPWLTHLIAKSRLCGDEDKDDQVVERLQLALDVLAAHAVYGSDPHFPRAEVLGSLLVLLRNIPMLMHDAIAALRSYGDMISHEQQGQTALIIELLDAALSDERRERDGALQCLVSLDLTELEFPRAVWLAMHSDLKAIATQVWEENALDVPSTYVPALVPLLQHAHKYVRESAARSIGAACALHPDTFPELLDALLMLYRSENYSLEPEYDQYGMVIESTLNRQDPWHVRLAVAWTLHAAAPSFRPADVVPFFLFALQPGVALSDRNEDVSHAMLDACTSVIDVHGANVLSDLLSHLEASLESESDAVTEASVVLLGRIAQYLPADSPQVRRVVDRLLSALRTPSELVQEAVASCLPVLVRTTAVAKDVPGIVDDLFVDLLHGEKYATRRGAAYGLAGIVKGRGVCSIRELHILTRLAEAIDDTSVSTIRQGALFAYEMLAGTLHVLLEPYVEGILEHLLVCFGDTHADVREATQDAARVLMRSLSGQCLKLILPSLLSGLDEKQWRMKKGAVELLGAMAFCAPRQLSAALPTVIPRLSDVLTDSHRQVSTAANQSLKQFGEVIHNPEIQSLVPVLLKALVDPNAKTASALKALLRTKFVHYIDAPSLALIAPIIERGLRERTVLLQKQAAQIVGNLASLTDTRDYVPYLSKYTPLVRVVLVSPVPDARGIAAKALGTLVERLGEVHFADLVPSLLQVLQTDATGVDRHGAAQGLAEVLAGLGMERMERLLPTIIENTQDSTSYVREGHLALLIYLPATFGARFIPHLGRIVPPIVASMADDIESVREASLRAGRMLISNYTQRSVDLLLPQLEPRLFDARHRVRLSALQLTADMLFRVCGISGKAEVEDETDEAAAASSSVQKTLVQVLGADRRARILAAVFILRQDPSIPVRQTAAHTWKALVHNTPRTAREVLPVMLDLLLGGALASDDSEQRDMAGRTLGELVRKLGEKILSETVPILSERAMHAPTSSTRAGVCRAVTDILANATKTQLEDHEDALIGVVRHALGDEAPDVRAAAAHALDAMQAHLGGHAIDATIPTLLEALDDERAPTALAALREVVRTQPEVVFPVVVPTLAHVPLSDSHASALVALLPVSSSALAQQVNVILSSLAASCDDETHVKYEVADALFAAIGDIDTLHQTVMQILGWLGARQASRQALACHLWVHFTKHVTVSWADYEMDVMRKLIALFEPPEERVYTAARSALEACVQTIPKEHWGALVVPLRRALESTGAPSSHLPGLCQPRGASPFVPVLLHGLLQGTAEQREQGALGLADLAEKTSADAIKPFITAMVGPLIRLCGDRHAPPVKISIVTSLDTLVRSVPMLVRPFYPQLQRSFQKALSDTGSGTVRMKAAHALGFLMGLQTRVEGVVSELVQTICDALVSPDDTSDAAIVALACILDHAPQDKIGEQTRASVVGCLESAFHAEEEPRESIKRALADLFASFIKFDTNAIQPLLASQVLQPAPVDVQLAALCVRACLENASDTLYDVARPPSLVAQLTSAWLSEAPSVARIAREARDMIRRTSPWATDASVTSSL